MKLIKRYLKINIDENETILLNCFNGNYLSLPQKEVEKIILYNSVSIEEITNNSILNILLQKEFIIDDDINEDELWEKTMSKMNLINNKYKKIINKINFILTYNCNFNCSYCYEKSISTIPNILTKEMVDKVFEMYGNNIKYIGIFGGEPFMAENYSIINYITNKWDAIYDFTTKRYEINKFMNILKKINIEKIQITIDGSKENHDKFRLDKQGNPTFDNILLNIESLLKNKIAVSIRMNVNASNFMQIYNYKTDLQNRFYKYDNILSFNIGPIAQINISDVQNIEHELYKIEIHNKNNYSNYNIIKNNEYLTLTIPLIKSLISDTPYKKSFVFCPASINARYFDPFGNIYSCVGTVGHEKYSIGKYYPNYIIYDKTIFDNNILNNLKCNKCNYAFLCGGGCPIKIKDSGVEVNTNPCQNTKFLINNIFPTLYKYLK